MNEVAPVSGSLDGGDLAKASGLPGNLSAAAIDGAQASVTTPRGR